MPRTYVKLKGLEREIRTQYGNLNILLILKCILSVFEKNIYKKGWKKNRKKEKNQKDSSADSRDYSGFLRFEPGTFRSSVWRSPNWAKSASDDL